MSANLKRFLDSLKSDPSTQETLNKATNQTSFAQVVVDTGAKKGFTFSIQDVKDAIRDAIGGSRELSDAELEAVAGAGDDSCPLNSLTGGSGAC